MYLLFKVLHVLAVVLFLGNIITGIFWKMHGDRSRDPRVIAAMIEGIIRSDRWFTVPGVVLIIITGFGTAGLAGIPMLRTPWILWSLILFSVSGIAFMAQLAPLQRKMLALALAASETTPFDWTLYWKLTRRWEFWGAVALVTPLAALVLMVFKPT